MQPPLPRQEGWWHRGCHFLENFNFIDIEKREAYFFAIFPFLRTTEMANRFK